MKEYIRIKKTTLRKWVIGLCAAAIVLGAALFLLPLLLPPKIPCVETCAYNVLTADGEPVVYFRSIGKDSIFITPTVTPSKVSFASHCHFQGRDLHAVVDANRLHVRRTIKGMEKALSELDYYLDVHDVQDEGFDMVAEHAAQLKIGKEEKEALLAALDNITDLTRLEVVRVAKTVRLDSVKLSDSFIEMGGGVWRWCRWTPDIKSGKGVGRDHSGRLVAGLWDADTMVSGMRIDTMGVYIGETDCDFSAEGHGVYINYRGGDGSYGSGSQLYEGHWSGDRQNGFGYAVDSKKLSIGEWRNGKCLGERLNYSSERIYGIDISKYQHGRGRRYYPIQWDKLRIIRLGRKASGEDSYPVSFVYIKSTEGTTIRNKYYPADVKQARKHGLRVGSYHFFSIRSTGTAQAKHFLRHTSFVAGDLPPVLDVEPTDKQIRQMGGTEVLFKWIRQWLTVVEKQTGVSPILYMNQNFINKYLDEAPDLKKYKIWIARYGDYKPDLKLVYWQLSPYGRVDGIKGDVDINVFNGYKGRYDRFIEDYCIK